MGLPLYKILEIYDPKRAAVWAKLANAPVGAQPVAIDLSNLGDRELEALEYIEEFVRLQKTRAFPYPLYVVSNIKNHRGVLELVPSLEHLPQYYKKKNRPLNMKENSMMAKVSLKQGKLENINLDEFKPLAKTYAAKHKVIFKKQSYLNYLESLFEGLRGK